MKIPAVRITCDQQGINYGNLTDTCRKMASGCNVNLEMEIEPSTPTFDVSNGSKIFCHDLLAIIFMPK
jgi:hypothetical protein